jgi:hypothetical protein
MNLPRIFSVALALIGLLSVPSLAAEIEKRVSYNGIPAPETWPPKIQLTRKPLAVPTYLLAPPAVIPIDVGRQLFVDDFLVENTTLTRTHHLPEY